MIKTVVSLQYQNKQTMSSYNKHRDPRDPWYNNPAENFFDDVIEALSCECRQNNETWLQSDQAWNIIQRAFNDEQTVAETADQIESSRAGI